MPDRKREQLLQLVDILASDSLTHDELRTFAYAILGPSAYENLEGKSKRDKAISLLEALESTDRIGELIDLIEERRPDIELPDLEAEAQPDSPEQSGDTDGQEHTGPASSSTRWPREVSPEFAARMRDRRPGYDLIYDLVSRYDTLSPGERAQVSNVDVINSYIQPMFEALGWSVSKEEPLNAVRGIEGSRVIQVDLLLTYRDLRVLVEVKKPGRRLGKQDDDQLFQYIYQTGNSWGFLTNFEAIRVLDFRDVNHSTLLLETSPRLYVTDDSEKHDLLAAEVFYERFAQPQPEGKPAESVKVDAIVSDPGQLIAEVEDGNLAPDEALAIARLHPRPAERAEALVKLAPHLSEPSLEEALTAARMIEDGASRAEALEGLVPHLSEELREQALEEAQAARAAAQESRTELERFERIEIGIRALADSPSKVDLLGFSDYADALADFIRNEKTEKPLTIGIDAAWGMGKTTLMLMIRDQLTKREKGKRGRSFPTVWFNAWKYDQEESLWAALALQILAEVRKQFNWWERARLWMKLNYQRLDRALLWRSVLKLLISALGIYLLGAAVLGIVALWLGTGVLAKYAGTVGILGFITAVHAAGKEIYDRLAGPFDLKLAEYVRKPNYKERIGFLAQFEEDFKRVIDAVTEDGKWPLVVFVDDLDRCAPPKPAEIIEAINILLDAEHCVFVIGMDAQAVAGSMEARYSSLQDYLGDAGDPGGLTLGQRFLEKIVQINFRIPRADPEVVKSFVDASLDTLGGEPEEPPEEEVSEAEQLIEAEQRAGKSLDEAAQAVTAIRPDIPREVVTKAQEDILARSFDDSEDVRRAIHKAAPYLGFNPRKIKRFINVFRLQALIANRRGLLESGVIRLDLLAKWVVIATRWPDFVEAVSEDEGFIVFLIEAHDLQRDLTDLHSTPGVDDRQRQENQNRVDFFLTDPRMKQWIDAADLIALLKGLVTQTGWQLSSYLHLVRIVSEGSLPLREDRARSEGDENERN